MPICFFDHVDSDAIGVSYSSMTTSFIAIEDDKFEHPAIIVYEHISLASARCLLMYLTLIKVFKHHHVVLNVVHIDKATTYVQLGHEEGAKEDGFG